MSENLYLAQGTAKRIPEEHLDNLGATYPDLHRRIDDELSELEPGEVAKDKNTLTVQSVNSYRNIQHFVHDEDSNSSEIP